MFHKNKKSPIMEWSPNRFLLFKLSPESDPVTMSATEDVDNPSTPIDGTARQSQLRDATDGEDAEREQELETVVDDLDAQLYPFSEEESKEIEETIGGLDLRGLSFSYRGHIGRGPAFTGPEKEQKPEFTIEDNKIRLGMATLRRSVNEAGEERYDVFIFSKYEKTPKKSGLTLSFTDRDEAIRATFALDFIMRQNVASDDKMGVYAEEGGGRTSQHFSVALMEANPNTSAPVMSNIPPEEEYKAEPYQVEDGKLVFKSRLYYTQVAPKYDEVSALCSPDVLDQMATFLNQEFQRQLRERERMIARQYES